MSSSRLRDQALTIFDVFCEIVITNRGEGDRPSIFWKYPEDYDDERTLKSIVEFAFPSTLLDGEAVQLFTFVLTDLDGRYSFGYCRHTPAKKSCFCVMSALPWTDVFYRLLNHVAGLTTRSPGLLSDEAESLLVRAYHQEIPRAGDRLTLDSGLGSGNKVEFVCPDDKLLPRIPDNRNLTEYYNAVREENMLAIFASLLCERRIVLTSSKLGKLSACVLAASGLLYPMYWQHIFIPVLPDHLVHYLHAPMPFLIGVPSSTFAKIQREHIDLSEVVVLHIDSEELVSPFSDFADLPSEAVQVLKKNLRSSNHLLGDGVARSFLRALVVLLAGYRGALEFRPGEMIIFSEEKFVQNRSASMRRFLEKMLHLQIFRQFIEDRLTTLNAGDEPRDEFEEECNLYSGKEYSRYELRYREWTEKSGTAVKEFSKRLKDKGHSAFKDFQSRIIGSSPSPAGAGRRIPSPQPLLRRFGSSINRQSPSPNRHGNSDRAKSFIDKSARGGERVPLKPDDDESASNTEEPSSSANFFASGVELLSELQYLMQRPNSFIERLEQQQMRFRESPTPAAACDSDAGPGVQEPLISISNGGNAPTAPRPTQEALLIDFGPAKLNPAELDIADFDPLITKSTSLPTSPKMQTLAKAKKESTTMSDLKPAADGSESVAFSADSASLWETFD